MIAMHVLHAMASELDRAGWRVFQILEGGRYDAAVAAAHAASAAAGVAGRGRCSAASLPARGCREPGRLLRSREAAAGPLQVQVRVP
jgi:hypothetical protein